MGSPSPVLRGWISRPRRSSTWSRALRPTVTDRMPAAIDSIANAPESTTLEARGLYAADARPCGDEGSSHSV
eukprot:7283010-Prymnesium_polylepis.1